MFPVCTLKFVTVTETVRSWWHSFYNCIRVLPATIEHKTLPHVLYFINFLLPKDFWIFALGKSVTEHCRRLALFAKKRSFLICRNMINKWMAKKTTLKIICQWTNMNRSSDKASNCNRRQLFCPFRDWSVRRNGQWISNQLKANCFSCLKLHVTYYRLKKHICSLTILKTTTIDKAIL